MTDLKFADQSSDNVPDPDQPGDSVPSRVKHRPPGYVNRPEGTGKQYHSPDMHDFLIYSMAEAVRFQHAREHCEELMRAMGGTKSTKTYEDFHWGVVRVDKKGKKLGKGWFWNDYGTICGAIRSLKAKPATLEEMFGHHERFSKIDPSRLEDLNPKGKKVFTWDKDEKTLVIDESA